MLIKHLRDLAHAKIFMVGIKGTGMSALAEILVSLGATIEGSDTHEKFYTDELLRTLRIPVYSLDDMNAVQQPYDFVIHSAAYDPYDHKQLYHFRTRSIPLFTYPQILGDISQHTFSVAVAGVHGKTTISGMSATIIQQLSLNGMCIVGSQINSLSNRGTYMNGTKFLIAETCEYRRHFLHFHPNIALVSNIELDHQDYYRDYTDIFSAFCELAQQIRPDGALIYCCDDKGASMLARELGMMRSDVRLIPYGESSKEDFRIANRQTMKSGMRFSVSKWDNVFEIPLPGTHMVLNATAALAVTDTLHAMLYNTALDVQAAEQAISYYSGAKRRMEIVGAVGGITIIDDYAHHPTAIKATLSALRQSHKYRRIIVDFMSHTYSRTLSLLDEFASSFSDADIVIAHRVYPSAREQTTTKISGKRLAEAIRGNHPHVHYCPYPLQATQFCAELLVSGDLFITLGAGDNWKLGRAVYKVLVKRSIEP